jgi:hypothetical protein
MSADFILLPPWPHLAVGAETGFQQPRTLRWRSLDALDSEKSDPSSTPHGRPAGDRRCRPARAFHPWGRTSQVAFTREQFLAVAEEGWPASAVALRTMGGHPEPEGSSAEASLGSHGRRIHAVNRWVLVSVAAVAALGASASTATAAGAMVPLADQKHRVRSLCVGSAWNAGLLPNLPAAQERDAECEWHDACLPRARLRRQRSVECFHSSLWPLGARRAVPLHIAD